MDKALDDLVRRVDEDRWLASRFAPERQREQLIAFYAVYYEIARTAESVTEPALGAIRLAWWREALAEVVSARAPRRHPALKALYGSAIGGRFYSALQLIVEAREADLGGGPFASWEGLESYLDNTAGLLMENAVAICGPLVSFDDQKAFVRSAARAWGLAGLLRAQPFWETRGRVVFPPGGDAIEMLERARANYAQCRGLAKALHTSTFPAFGYVATLPGYFRALAQGRAETALLGRQAIMIAASATGRV